MSTISVPLTPELEEFINRQVKSGKSANKAHVVRYALQRYSEDEAIEAILQAKEEISSGKGLSGDLRELVKKIR